MKVTASQIIEKTSNLSNKINVEHKKRGIKNKWKKDLLLMEGSGKILWRL